MQAVPFNMKDQNGRNLELSFIGNSSNRLMTFVSLSTSDHLQTTSKLRRVIYLYEDNQLIRVTTLSNKEQVEISRKTLIKNVENLEIRFGEELDEAEIDWPNLKHNSNIKLPVRVGFPGPASFKTLLNFGIMSGVGNSLSFLKKNSSKVTDLLTKTSNDEMFIELANFSKEQSSFKNFHCFPFGGFEKTCHWLNALQSGDFTMENDKIVLHNKIF